jgi:VanZ family protein
MRAFFFYWLPVFAWMAIIFILSTSRFSMARMSRFMVPILKLVFRVSDEERLKRAHTRVRESAHFVEYLILSVLIFRALRADDATSWEARWMVLSIVIAGAYGFADELHQRWESGRTSKLRHALIDVAGCLAGQVVVGLYVLAARAA